MAILWIITARWAGNLQNVPLVGYVHDYKQIEPGLIEVAIICKRANVAAQVDRIVGDWCSGITIEPHFREAANQSIINTPEYRAMDKSQMHLEDADRYTEDA